MRYSDHIFFDLDHTLWDYDTNAAETLKDLFVRYEIASLGEATEEQFVKVFFTENEKLWRRFDNGEIEKNYIRQRRFPLVFKAIGIEEFKGVESFQNDFLQECPRKSKLVDGAKELLDELRGRFRMSIITNGFDEIQFTKLQSSGIHNYFQHIITSEGAGVQKPSIRIFEFALEQSSSRVEESVMVGDNLDTDIRGARDCGMDQVFFNFSKAEHSEPVTFEIKSLSELPAILL